MMIDINQLPIPDWGLACPSCGYALRGLPEHRCAECGMRFQMSEIVKSWHALRPPQYHGKESPLPDYGFLCAACGDALAGSAAQNCRHCGAAYDTVSAIPTRDWFPISAISKGQLEPGIVAAELEHEAIPFRWESQEASPQSLYMGSQGWMRDVLVRRDFYFDARIAVVRVLRRNSELNQGSDWSCSQCGEANPPTFEICWKCGAEPA